MQSFFDPPSEILVTEVPTEITILEKDGAIRVLHPDGKKHKTDNGASEIKTHWDKDKLVVETEPLARGPKLREVLTVSNDHTQLIEDIHLEGRMGAVDVRRVYDTLPSQ